MAPARKEWLELAEDGRLELVRAYHRRHRIRLPNVRLHATIHVVVENQLALGETVVVDTLSRLQREGLSRHDAIHAIGSILAEHLHELVRGAVPEIGVEPHQAYFDRLKSLTASAWRNAG